MVLSAGNCPICGVLGKVLILADVDGGALFAACNQCSGASRLSDQDGPFWLAQSVDEYARGGFRPATREELAATGNGGVEVEVVDDNEFELMLE